MSLVLNQQDATTGIAGGKRIQSVMEALGWPKGENQNQRVSTVVFEKNGYQVRLSKPGKEAEPEYNRCKYADGHIGNNPNDMRPEITLEGELIGNNATFGDIFREIEILKNTNEEGLELFGCLLSRSAFMADHTEVEPGIWRYRPPEETLEALKQFIPIMYGVPTEVFLHYLNALALNEDTKYHTLGYDITGQYGRRNSLLTCVHLIAVFLGRISIVDFAASFSRPPAGISAISKTKMWEFFPDLVENVEEGNQRV